MNKNPIAIYDFETTSPNPHLCYPIQLACIIINPSTLEVYDGGEFNWMMQVTEEELAALDQKTLDGALKVNKKTREEIIAAPPPERVMKEFVAFMKKFSSGRNEWGCPILAGHNIDSFDNVILRRLAEKYKYLTSDLKINFVHPIQTYDTIKDYFWFNDQNNWFAKFKLDYIREKMGLSLDNAHDALGDVYTTYAILRRHLEWKRRLNDSSRVKDRYQDCFKEAAE